MARTLEEVQADATQILNEWFWNLSPKDQFSAMIGLELTRNLPNDELAYKILLAASPTFPVEELKAFEKEKKEIKEQQNGTSNSEESSTS